jgi:hypothetical protein
MLRCTKDRRKYFKSLHQTYKYINNINQMKIMLHRESRIRNLSLLYSFYLDEIIYKIILIFSKNYCCFNVT